MSHSQFHSIDLFILRHAWLNLWDKRMLLAESTRLLSLNRGVWLARGTQQKFYLLSDLRSEILRIEGNRQSWLLSLVSWRNRESRFEPKQCGTAIWRDIRNQLNTARLDALVPSLGSNPWSWTKSWRCAGGLYREIQTRRNSTPIRSGHKRTNFNENRNRVAVLFQSEVESLCHADQDPWWTVPPKLRPTHDKRENRRRKLSVRWSCSFSHMSSERLVWW